VLEAAVLITFGYALYRRHDTIDPTQVAIPTAQWHTICQALVDVRTWSGLAFLAIGEGASQWLLEAAATGTNRIRTKMAEAVTLAKLHGARTVDRALGTAAAAGRFADGDLQAILDHQRHAPNGQPRRAGETHSLQPGTGAWAAFGAGEQS
jgi:hypothetical protein